ncbi:MAG: 16S rRNA (guanine(966)-N(2))-methyltransferase RsmD [Tepidiformaceae bacterium]
MPAKGVRISGGSARGIPLTEPRGVRLRPTSGLVREAMFNILGERIEGASVLDLYAGTGALGIEALSRGAASAVFVEGAAGAVTAIFQSLARTGLAEAGRVIRGRLPGALGSIQETFDIIFIDPPYNDPDAEETLIGAIEKLAEGGTIVYEHSSRYNPPQGLSGLEFQERRVYGDSALALYLRMEVE